MSKKVCKTGKDEKGKNARFTCKKCGLMASKEKVLCKPKEL
jgi:hypothetical protein